MTIETALSRVNAMKPNAYEDTDKIRWLSDLDGMVFEEVLKTHEDREPETFTPYTALTERSTELLIPEPYSDVYVKYLSSQIDFHNAEYARYNNSTTMFNIAYTAFVTQYHRTHLPLQAHRITE